MRKRVVVAVASVLAGGIGVAAWLAASGTQSPTSEEDKGAAPAGAQAPTRANAPALRKGSAAATSAPEARPASGETLARTVRVTADGKPVANATVHVTTPNRPEKPTTVVTTNDEGRAGFLVPAGSENWGFDVFAPGFRPYLWWGDPFTDGVLEVTLEPGISFRGTVLDAETHEPIAGASVRLWVGDRGVSVEVGPTGADGRFQVPGVRDDGDTTLFVIAPGYVDDERQVRIDGGRLERGEPVVRLARAWALEGVVKSSDGVPVVGAQVCVGPDRAPPGETEAWRSDEDRLEYYEQDDRSLLERRPDVKCMGTRADGTFRIDGLSYSTAYQVVASASGHAASHPVRGVGVKPPGRSLSIALSLRAPATVFVDVFGLAGTHVPDDARVRLFGMDELPREPVHREPDGRLRFADVEPGPAHVYVNASGFRPAVKRIDVREAAITPVEIALEVGGAMDGVVVDPDGRPLEDALVEVAPASRNPEIEGRFLVSGRTFKTDAEGRFLAQGLETGSSFLVATWRKDFRSSITLVTRKPLRLSVPARGVRVVLGRLGAVGLRLLTSEGKAFVGNVSTWLGYSAGASTDVREVKDGAVTVEGLDDGWYRFVVVPEGLAWVSRFTWIEKGVPVDFGPVTVDAGVTVSGRVVDAAGRPVPESHVVCREFEERRTVTDREGRFTFARFPRERFVLLATAGGSERGALVVEPGTTAGLDIRVGRPASVRGRIRDAAGASRAARLTFAPPGTSPPQDSLRDGDDFPSVMPAAAADGRFDGELPAGRWIGWWRDAKGENRRVGEWTFAAGGTYDLEIELPE